MTPEISNTSLLFLIVFVLIPISLSYLYSLKLSQSIAWSSLRGVTQLFLVGYILSYLFSLPSFTGITFMLIVMISVATFHASRKGDGIPFVKIVVFVTILGVELLILTMWLMFNMISFTPEQVIPMSGMIIGNSMVAVGLALERMKSEFQEGKAKVIAALSLGATAKQATKLINRKVVKAAMIPNIDGLKTVGLVQLPGMMTGLILAGVDPILAIRYQIVISLSIFTCVSMSAMIVSIITYRFFYNKNLQLLDIGQST